MIPKEAGVLHTKNWGVQGPCLSCAGSWLSFPTVVTVGTVPSAHWPRPVGYLLQDLRNGVSGFVDTRCLGRGMVFFFIWEVVQPAGP